ncbi:MAG: restriction endonuclease subunit S [Bacteroidota bacterium]
MEKNKRQQVPQLRFPGFEGAWEEKKVGNCTTKIGSGSTPRGGSEVYTDKGIPFIRSQNVVNNKLDFEKIAYIPKDIHARMKGSSVQALDILLNITGASIGRTCVVPINFQEGNVNQHVCIIRLKKTYSPFFLQAALSAFKGQKAIIRNQVGGSREGLNFQSVRTLRFYLPSLPEQQKIANCLTTIDTRIQQLRRKVALLEDYKKGLMQQLFSQRLRFKDAAGQDFPEWEEKRLGDIASFSKGKGISKSELDKDGKFQCIIYGELYTRYNEMIDFVQSRTSIEAEKLVFSKANDVLVPASGETHLDIAKASCVLKSNIALGGDINIIRSKTVGVFLAYYLNSSKREKIASLAQGSSVIHLYPTQLKSLKLQLPSLPEQQKIADCLSAIDRKIQLTQNQLAQTEGFKKGLLQQLFV